MVSLAILAAVALAPATGFATRPVPRPLRPLLLRGGATATDEPKNSAFVFIKPHAVTEPAVALVREALVSRGLTILGEGSISSEQIDAKRLIDQHYYAIASKATMTTPAELNVPADKFKDAFGVEWADVLAEGKAYNAMDACEVLGLEADALEAANVAASKDGKLVKLGGGFYCGLIDSVEGKPPIYVFNAFFMAMRAKFTRPGASIHYFNVEWDAATLPWADFRGKLLGPTDPADAPADSIRGTILAQYAELGLASAPNTGENGVHASASPFEALAERLNWLEGDVAADPFGARLLAAGVPAETIAAWTVDPVVAYPDGGKGSVFDALEDMDAPDCLAKCAELAKL